MSGYNPNKVKILHKVLRVNSENQYGDGIQLTYLPEPFSEGCPSSVEGREKSQGFTMPHISREVTNQT